MLQLLEQCRVDHGKAQPDSAFPSKPDDASLSLKDSFAFRERKTDVEEASKPHRFFQAIHAHAAIAEIPALDPDFLTLLILYNDVKRTASAKELLRLQAE